MGKELTGSDRRKKILNLMRKADMPLSGTQLGKETGVSRQIVVQDIALLRTQGYTIVSTAKGYFLAEAKHATRLIKVCHSDAQVEDELTTIVDLGGSVLNVMVNHKAYGKLEASLNIRNRRDIQKFITDIQTGKSTPLLNVTSGYHFHRVAAENEEILDEIENALREKNYLAEILPYEKIDLQEDGSDTF